MDENPYRAPAHYATRRPFVPLIAYVLTGGTLAAGATFMASGCFYFLMPRLTLGGMAIFGFGVYLAYAIAQYRRKVQ